MIGRGDTRLVDDDLVVAAQTMKNHLALLNRQVVTETPAERLAKSLHDVVTNGSGEATNNRLRRIDSRVGDMHDNICG
jgi:hypothetical protein